MAQIRVENVRKDFGDFTAVQSSSFTVEDGEFFYAFRAIWVRKNHNPPNDGRSGTANQW